MKVLVTGGSGVIGASAVTELLRRGHEVVLLTRHATRDAEQWPRSVTPRPGDIAAAASIRGAADGCDVALHMAGVVEERGGASFDRINVEGTRNVVAESARAGVRRFVFVSSLGACTGKSDYHKSKAAGERLVRDFPGEWVIVRPGNVYGPGDGQISLLLRLVRGPSPVVPRVGDGNQPLQPLAWEDCAKALALAVERPDLAATELDIAGTEVTSQNDLIRRFSMITGCEAHPVPVPDFLVSLGAKMISAIGWHMSFNEDQMTMLHEGSVIPPEHTNALTDVLGLEPTPLDAGLRQLVELQPDQLPTEGVGVLKRKHYWADIARCGASAEWLFDLFTRHFIEVVAVVVRGAESHAPLRIEEGTTVTLALPMRGHVQVRAVEVEPRKATFLTLEGHPLAGAVRFLSEVRGDRIRFQVEVFDRAANVIDLFAMRTLGDFLQNHTWTQVVENMVERSGGDAPDGVRHESRDLDDDEAKRIEDWLAGVTMRFKRHDNAAKIAGRQPSARAPSDQRTSSGRD